MRINKRKRLSPIAIVAIVAGVILLGVGSVYAYQSFVNNSDQTSDPSAPANEPIPATPTTTPESKGGEQFTNPDESEDSGTPPTSTTSMRITATNQTDDTLQVRTLIQDVWASGTCELDLTKDGVSVVQEVETQSLPSSSTCRGFDIPLTELSPGLWTISINARSGDKTASVNGEVSIQ